MYNNNLNDFVNVLLNTINKQIQSFDEFNSFIQKNLSSRLFPNKIADFTLRQQGIIQNAAAPPTLLHIQVIYEVK